MVSSLNDTTLHKCDPDDAYLLTVQQVSHDTHEAELDTYEDRKEKNRQLHMKFQRSLISSWWWSQILLPFTAAASSPGASNRPPKLKSCFWLKLYAASLVLREHQDVWWKYLCSDITLNWPQPPAMHEQHLISSFSYWVDTVPTVSSQANVVKSRSDVFSFSIHISTRINWLLCLFICHVSKAADYTQ